MSRQWDALVIGAGPAGLRAASVIAESGLEVVLVDEQAFHGGQIYRQVTAPGAEERFAEAADYRDGTGLSGASGVPARNTCRKRRSGSWNRIASWPPVVRKSSICGPETSSSPWARWSARSPSGAGRFPGS
ncbi:MAG: FAD-dependent oxidoreductase [Bilophila wadsworthia]